MKKLWRYVLAALIVVSLTFLGCESNVSMSQMGASTETPFKMLKIKNLKLKKVFQKSKWIEPDGGTIKVGDATHGYSKLVFPSGAVTDQMDEVRVTFWWESTGFLQGGADFSPHGTQFNKPVRIELSYKDADLTGVDENTLKIWYYNEDAEEWELIGDEVDKHNKTVIGYTTHFSRYAIGAD